MYVIVQSGIIAHVPLRKHLRLFGYEPEPITLGLMRHNKNRTTFTLMVDGLGIKHQRN